VNAFGIISPAVTIQLFPITNQDDRFPVLTKTSATLNLEIDYLSYSSAFSGDFHFTFAPLCSSRW
jgi:hypothetical protein